MPRPGPARFALENPLLVLASIALTVRYQAGLWLGEGSRLVQAAVREPEPRIGGGDPSRADACVRAAGLAARLVPGTRCLGRALTARALLRREGIPSSLVVGVKRDTTGIAAHAWLEHDGRVLINGGPAGHAVLLGPDTRGGAE